MTSRLDSLFPTFRKVSPTGWIKIMAGLVALCGALLFGPSFLGVGQHSYDPAALEKKAEAGDADSQYWLAKRYRSANPPDFEKAFYWHLKSAEQGHKESQNDVGAMYLGGKGVAADPHQARFWYEKAAQQGLTLSQANLAIMYDRSIGIPPDHQKALYWYEKAAAQGEARALTNLGHYYTHGEHVEKDYAKALELYQQAALQQQPEALNLLGYHSFYGYGIERDLMKAGEYYKQAADLGDAEAQALVEQYQRACTTLTRPLVREAVSEKVAIDCLFAAGTGSLKGIYSASRIYERGSPAVGIERDMEKSYQLMQQFYDQSVAPELQ
ncbi:MAG: sel1 repeat family protein [Alphaproteobacteria bacterium]|nr:sel1 repeat family protein [Alphaproteobacteria bacterium]